MHQLSLSQRYTQLHTKHKQYSLSPVSSSPMRACVCDMNSKPLCVRLSLNSYKVYRGEGFNISIALVGYDYGVTAGAINAGFLPSGTPSLYPNQYHQLIDSSRWCSNITYSICSKNIFKTLYLYTSEVNNLDGMIKCYNSTKQRCGNIDLFKIPVIINITLLNGCPPGFLLSLQD